MDAGLFDGVRTLSLLARLIEAGTPAELVAEVARELARAEVAQEALESRRSKDRDRQSRRRGHVMSRDNADFTQPPTPSLSPQTPQTHPHPRENKTPARKGHRLPADWQPEPITGSLGIAVSGWPTAGFDRELDRFRDWAASASGPNALKTDWQAAWRNWLRKADDEGRYARRDRAAANDGSYLDHISKSRAQGP